MEALITNGAMATDGGSISLSGVDAEGAPLSVFLDWSIQAQRTGTRRLEVNGQTLAIGSMEEVQFLQLLTGARIADSSGAPSELTVGAVLGSDLADYTAAIQKGPKEALAALVSQLLTNVTSEAYSRQSAPNAKPTAVEDEILELLLDGKDLDALKLYRKANPDVSLADAKAAIQRLKNE